MVKENSFSKSASDRGGVPQKHASSHSTLPVAIYSVDTKSFQLVGPIWHREVNHHWKKGKDKLKVVCVKVAALCIKRKMDECNFVMLSIQRWKKLKKGQGEKRKATSSKAKKHSNITNGETHSNQHEES